ncbi:membrane protein [Sporosarcina luteola]|uniref:Membrane protein n=1 Tax=Sporosarcina luteola TaxID=582850 RepID=A0A511Z863_9BACL|nr:tail protein X [Sporosarcina luteola]GEN83632.1 membrane protein [Sporosarcina luteola]
MTYATVQGDTWDILSKKVYGSEFHTDMLMKANPDVVDVIMFSSGVLLLVPEIDTVEQFDSLPPWKRVSN